jgi:hypothetical protein
MAAHAIDGSAMESFTLAADVILVDLSKQFDTCKEATFELFTYFGEEQSKPLNEFFGTLSRFIAMFESARAEVRRKQELKVRASWLQCDNHIWCSTLILKLTSSPVNC